MVDAVRLTWRRGLAAALAVVLGYGAVTARLFVWPAIGYPARADAIVLFAGPGDRLPVALELAREHRASTLVVSQGWEGYGGACPAPPPGVRVVCFDANPGNTRGEAEFVGRLASRRHWRSLILVTTRAQDTRARVLVHRCFAGSLYVATAPIPAGDWPYQIAYGWGALVKALVVHPSC